VFSFTAAQLRFVELVVVVDVEVADFLVLGFAGGEGAMSISAGGGSHVTFRDPIPSHRWRQEHRHDQWALHRAIDKFERQWNYDASYMRNTIDASPRAAWLFSRVTALGQFRRDLPIEAWCAAGITAVRHEDCGPCTQLGVTMAERAGVIVDGPEGPVQTAAFEIEGDVIRALYVVRNPDKLQHLAAASTPHESGLA